MTPHCVVALGTPNPYASDCRCPPFWVATRTATARCENDPSRSVTVTRQGRSEHSMQDAINKAEAAAMAEAKAELICVWVSERCIIPACHTAFAYDPVCRTAMSNSSQADADYKAFLAAQEAAIAFCD